MRQAGGRAIAGTCPHCGSVHAGGIGRCPSTRLPIGGDPSLVGQTLVDRYELVRLLGDGGMGAVYKAVDHKLSRFVAIKVLHRHVASDPLLVERLAREARSAAAIGHPNIVEVLDVTEDRIGPLMVMEYLRGRSLASLLERDGALPIARACSILAHTLAGLAAAHERGVLHRDLKPANLMLVSRLGDHDFAKVCDFGFAAFLDPARAASRELTPARTLVGTPRYAAPERWLGDDRRDPRTDVYSAGVILYEMLAARRPFEAETMSELFGKVRLEPPPSLRAMRADVPAALEAVVLKALAKRCEDRWSSAGELAAALVPFGGRHVVLDPDARSEVFALDLAEIRARESRVPAEEQVTELSVSDAIAEGSAVSVVAREVARDSGRQAIVPDARIEPPIAPAASAPEGRVISGPIALAVLRFLSLRFGDALLKAVLDTLPPAARRVYADGIAPEAWVPYDAVRDLMEHLDTALGHGDLSLVVECGRGIAEGLFETRKELEPVASTPETYFSDLPAVGRQLVRGIEYVLRRAGRGYGRVEIVEHTARPSMTGCVATLGFLERSLVRSGARDVEVTLVSCRALGDARCLFDATWLA